EEVRFTVRGGEFSQGDLWMPPEASVWPEESGYFGFDPTRPGASAVNLALLQQHLYPRGPNERPRGVATVVAWTRDLDAPVELGGAGDHRGRSLIIARGQVSARARQVTQGSVRREVLRGPAAVERP